MKVEKSEIPQMALRNFYISDAEARIPYFEKQGNKKTVNALKEKIIEYENMSPTEFDLSRRPYNVPTFKNLDPSKGYIRIMKSIIELAQLLGHNPIKRELNEYLFTKYQLTGRNNETIQALRNAKMLGNERKGYFVTEFGQAVIDAYSL